ncbi:hypothetical protein AAIB41_03550 [Brucella sp. BE17]|uniref:hypothetical protein n=1 Tax=Brucella sp. BE17 TaxID=3142977 RepID=UPI0031BB84CC
MSETEIIKRPRESGIDPEVEAMLDYFGDRVESVTVEHENNGMTIRSTITVRDERS